MSPSDSGLCAAEFFVVLQDQRGLFWLKALQELEQLARIEGLEIVVGSRAEVMPECSNQDDRQARQFLPNMLHHGIAWHISNSGIEDYGVDCGKLVQRLEGFVAAVCGDDVELGGLDDKLPGRDAAGMLLVDDKKAGSDHGSVILWLWRSAITGDSMSLAG
jgi:hypothetical protein